MSWRRVAGRLAWHDLHGLNGEDPICKLLSLVPGSPNCLQGRPTLRAAPELVWYWSSIQLAMTASAARARLRSPSHPSSRRDARAGAARQQGCMSWCSSRRPCRLCCRWVCRRWMCRRRSQRRQQQAAWARQQQQDPRQWQRQEQARGASHPLRERPAQACLNLKPPHCPGSRCSACGCPPLPPASPLWMAAAPACPLHAPADRQQAASAGYQAPAGVAQQAPLTLQLWVAASGPASWHLQRRAAAAAWLLRLRGTAARRCRLAPRACMAKCWRCVRSGQHAWHSCLQAALLGGARRLPSCVQQGSLLAQLAHRTVLLLRPADRHLIHATAAPGARQQRAGQQRQPAEWRRAALAHHPCLAAGALDASPL